VSRSKETLAKALVTTGLLTEAEVDASRVTNDQGLTEWIAGQGILPAKVVNQALDGAALTLGRYRIVGRVGRGGMGAVLRAHDASLHRYVAIKVLPQRAKEEDLKRFRREAKVLATINHANVVRIFSYEVVAGCAFLVMQLVEGPSLEKRLSEPPYFTDDEAWDLLTQSVAALACAERHQILHRDIKPGNILCEEDGDGFVYRLCDFGLARVQTEPMGRTTSAGFAMGTPAYMSPEQVKGEPLDSRSDMYGLGLTIYQALTGEIPFEDVGQKIAVILAARLHTDVYDVREKRPETTPELAEFLLRLVARDHEQRPGSWEEIHRELLRRKKGLKDSAGRRSVNAPEPVKAGGPGPQLLAVAVAIALVLGVLIMAVSGVLAPAPFPAAATPTPIASTSTVAQSKSETSTVEPKQGSIPAVVPPKDPPDSASPLPTSVPKSEPEVAAAWKGKITSEALFSEALEAAEQGDAVAAYQLGHWFNAKNEAIEAFDWFQRSAVRYPPAMVALALAYAGGVGVEADPKRARAEFQRAAEAGDPDGAYHLASLLEDEDPSKARELFFWASELGDPRAQLALARMHAEGLGGPRDLGAAQLAYRKLAEGGVALAMHRLGVLLLKGEGVERDPKQAQDLFLQSADSVSASWTYLGELATERGAATEACGYFLRAAKGGDARGMVRLALALNTGRGVELDKTAAFRWMGKAAELGDPGGMGEFGTMLTLGLGTEKDLEAGVRWYRKAAAAGDPWAMNNLALAYDLGEGVPQDDAQADTWYRKAAATGNELGQKNLAVWERLANVKIEEKWKNPYPQRGERTLVTVKKKGGSAKTESAVAAALGWLVRHQEDDGSWDADGWTTHCEGEACGGPSTSEAGVGESQYDVGVTSLALLAFLGQGNTHLGGPYKIQVRKGLRWLMGQQDARGAVGLAKDAGATTYSHALAAIVFCEAFSLTGDLQLATPAENAIDACLAMQTEDMGWKYGYDSGKSDSSVTGWMIQAMSAARDAGAEVPRAAWAGAVAWFKSVTNSAGRTGYESRGGGSAFLKRSRGRFDALPVMTAACLLSNSECGVRKRDPIFKKQIKVLQESLPSRTPKRVSYYYWYYGSYALFRRGSNVFRRWNKALKQALLPSQNSMGCAKGSWEPAGEWCIAGGRVYAVALNALTLEVYYRKAR
jgi:TPR repeat protein/serine/threonine protein kinase